METKCIDYTVWSGWKGGDVTPPSPTHTSSCSGHHQWPPPYRPRGPCLYDLIIAVLLNSTRSTTASTFWEAKVEETVRMSLRIFCGDEFQGFGIPAVLLTKTFESNQIFFKLLSTTSPEIKPLTSRNEIYDSGQCAIKK